MAISLIGSAASAVGPDMAPYFEPVLLQLKRYLTVPIKQTGDDTITELDEQNQRLLTQSMDTLGTLAKSVGPTSFGPTVAEETCTLGINLMAAYDDPDVRKCAYGLFAAVASMVKDKIATALPTITARMIETCASKNGISFQTGEDGAVDAITDPLFEGANDDEDASSADSSAVLTMPLLWVGVARGSGVEVEGRGIATTTTGRGPL